MTYAELEPYYTKVEMGDRLLGAGRREPVESPRSKPYPLPPMPNKSSGVLMERAAQKLGYLAVPCSSPCCRPGVSRPFGVYSLRIFLALDAQNGAKSSFTVGYHFHAGEIQPLRNPRECLCAGDALVDGSGKVTGAVCSDADQKEVFRRRKR